MQDKKGKNKFNFTTLDELNNIKSENKVVDVSKEISDSKLANNLEIDNTLYNNSFKKRLYFSFETRVTVLIGIILFLFFGICYFSVQAMKVTVDKEIHYTENSDVRYEVCLKDKSDCLGENLNYNSNLIDSLRLHFNYLSTYDKKWSLKTDYKIVSILNIYDAYGKSIYNDEDDILTDSTSMNNRKTFKKEFNTTIDYNKYNDSFIEYCSNHDGVYTGALEVVLYVFQGNEGLKSASLSVPLNNNNFSISKGITDKKSEVLYIRGNKWNKYNSLCAIIASVLTVMLFIVLLRTVYLVKKVVGKKDKYQEKIQEIIGKYNNIIVTTRDGYKSNVKRREIKINSFEELLKISETLEKAIIYSKVNDVKSEFIVEDIDKLYKYVLKEVDL